MQYEYMFYSKSRRTQRETTYFSHVLGVLDVGLWLQGKTDVSYRSSLNELAAAIEPTNTLPQVGHDGGLKDVEPESSDTNQTNVEEVGREGQDETSRVGSGSEHFW
jgi:hypothetical protein